MNEERQVPAQSGHLKCTNEEINSRSINKFGSQKSVVSSFNIPKHLQDRGQDKTASYSKHNDALHQEKSQESGSSNTVFKSDGSEDSLGHNVESMKQLTKSARRKLRRGPKRRRTGRPNKDYSALVLSNLQQNCTKEQIEVYLQEIAGFNSENSVFYIELCTKYPVYANMLKEAVIKFLDTEHLDIAYEKFHQFVKLLPIFTVTIDRCGQFETRLDAGFRLRCRFYFQSISEKIAKANSLKKREEEKLEIENKKDTKKDKEGNVNSERNTQAHIKDAKSNITATNQSIRFDQDESQIQSSSLKDNKDEGNVEGEKKLQEHLQDTELNIIPKDIESNIVATNDNICTNINEICCRSNSSLNLDKVEESNSFKKLPGHPPEEINLGDKSTDLVQHVAIKKENVTNEDKSTDLVQHVAIKNENVTNDDESSNDSTKTLLLNAEPFRFDSVVDTIAVKKEPLDLKPDVNKLNKNLSIKQEPSDLMNTKTKSTEASNNSINELDHLESRLKVHKALNNLNPNSKVDEDKQEIKNAIALLNDANKVSDDDDDKDDVVICDIKKEPDLIHLSSDDDAIINLQDDTEDLNTLYERNKMWTRILKNGKFINLVTSVNKEQPTKSNNKVLVSTTKNFSVSKEIVESNKLPDSTGSLFIHEPTSTIEMTETPSTNESDESHCKILHIKNLPSFKYQQASKILNNLIAPRISKDQVDKEFQLHVMIDEVELKPTGEALVKLPTHEEAVRICKEINGAKVGNNNIEVSLDIGHKILRDNMIFKDMTSGTKRRKAESNDQDKEDGPTAKKSRNDLDLLMDVNIERIFLPPEDHDFEDYGFRPKFLQKLGLKPPLTSTVIVKDLHEMVDEAKLHEVFSLAGDIRRLALDMRTRKARIEYDHPVEAVQAIHMFGRQKLYGRDIDISMYDSRLPRPLPMGLSGIDKGFGKNGQPLRGVRTTIELKKIQEILYELKKMNKFDNNDTSAPFPTWYERKRSTTSSTSSSTDSSTSNSSEEITSHKNDKKDKCHNEIVHCTNMLQKHSNYVQKTDDRTRAIEDIGSLLKAKGLIDKRIDCKDPKNIIAALQTERNDASNTKSQNFTIQSSKNTNTPFYSNVHNERNRSVMKVSDPIVKTNVKTSITNRLSDRLNPPLPTNLRWEHQNIATHTHQSMDQAHSSRNNQSNTNSEYEKSRNELRANKSYNTGPHRLIFQNLPKTVTKQALTKKMLEVGDVLFCEISSTGCAYVLFGTSQEAERCYRLFHKSKVDGQIIDVIAP